MREHVGLVSKCHNFHQVDKLDPQDGRRPDEPGILTESEAEGIGGNPVKIEYLDSPIKSESDKKDYR